MVKTPYVVGPPYKHPLTMLSWSAFSIAIAYLVFCLWSFTESVFSDKKVSELVMEEQIVAAVIASVVSGGIILLRWSWHADRKKREH